LLIPPKDQDSKEKLVRNVSVLVCLLAFCNLTLLGQTEKGPRIIHSIEKSPIHVPPEAAPAGLQKIYSNLGSLKTDLYNGTYGWLVTVNESVAIPFTPKSDAHISQVEVAAQYLAGANQVNVSIHEGADDIPEKLLAGPVTVKNLPEQGTCCTLAVASFSPIAVSAGTRYWVVVGTPRTGTGSDFEGVWDAVVRPDIPVAIDDDGSWSLLNGYTLPAGEVLGTIP
jgi:hypothetical protein